MRNTNKSIIKKPNTPSNLPPKKQSLLISPNHLYRASIKPIRTLVSWPVTSEDRVRLFERYSHGHQRFSFQMLKNMIDSEEIFIGISQEALKKAMKFGVSSNDGFVDRTEFPYFLRNLRYFSDLHKAFSKMDDDHDNRLKKSEFVESRGVLDAQISEAEAEKLFHVIEGDSVGAISYDEFCTWGLKQPTILGYNNKEYFQEIPNLEDNNQTGLQEPSEEDKFEGEDRYSFQGGMDRSGSFLQSVERSRSFIQGLTEESEDRRNERSPSKSSEELMTFLMKQVQMKNEEITALKAKLVESSGELALKQKIAELEAEFKSTSDKLVEDIREKDILEVKIATLHHEISEKEDKIAGFQSIEVEYRDKIRRLEQEITEKNHEIAGLQCKGTEYKDQIRVFELQIVENEGKKREKEALEAEITRFISEIQLKDEKINKFEAQKADFDAKIIEKDRMLADFETKIGLKDSKIIENETKINKLHEIIAQIKDLEAKIDDLKAQIRDYEAKTVQNQNKINDYEAKINDFEAKIIEKDRHLKDYEAKISLKDSKILDYETKINDLAEKQAQISDLQAKMASSEPKTTENEAILMEKDFKINSLEAKLAESTAKIATFQEETFKKEGKYKKEAESKEETIEKLRESLDSELKTRETHENTIRQLESSLKGLESHSELVNNNSQANGLSEQSNELRQKEKVIAELLSQLQNRDDTEKKCNVCRIF